tara:strand:- start:14823 stop:15281 length:459 start_codon:yes stop_codon:yes gene_type:complete
MSGPTTPPTTNHDTDDEETPKASHLNRQDPNMPADQPPPPYNGHSASTTPFTPYHDDFEERERRWRASLPQLRHVPPPEDDDRVARYGDVTSSIESEGRRRDAEFRAAIERRRARDINLDEWSACIGVWLLTALLAMLVTGAAAVIWMLVTR